MSNIDPSIHFRLQIFCLAMRIRIYSPFFPYPATDGCSVVTVEQIRHLARSHLLEICYWLDLEKHEEAALSSSVSFFKISGAGGPCEGFVAKAVRIFRSLFSLKSSQELLLYPPNASLNHLDRNFDLGVYYYSHAAGWGEIVPKREKRIACYLQNIESDLIKTRFRSTRIYLDWIHILNSWKMRRRESKLSYIFDQLWFISPMDLQRYCELNPKRGPAELKVIPPIFDPSIRGAREGARCTNSFRLGFIGRLDFPPNEEGMLWFLEKVAPQLLGLGFAGEINVIGKNATPRLVNAAKRFPFLKFQGFVENLDRFWEETDLMLVPHVVGSGVRIKLLESIARGIPVITHIESANRIATGLQKIPGLYVGDAPGFWIHTILGLQRESIEAIRTANFPNHLMGQEVYQFLDR